MSHWLTRYLLTLPPPAARPHHAGLDQAAVLVPLVKRQDGWYLLLTRRAATLRHHGGQVSFPGGRRDSADASLIATALRETHEELGIAPALVSVQGKLPALPTVSRFWVQPVLACVSHTYHPTPNPGEVARVFEVPLSFLLNPAHYRQKVVIRQGKRHPIWFIPWQDELIWGATAAMIQQLACRLDAERWHSIKIEQV